MAESIIALPFILVIGIKGSTGALFWLFGILIFLILPIIPLTAESIITFCIMKFLPYAKNKDLFKILGGLITLAIGIIIQIAIKQIIESSPDVLIEFLKDNYNIVKMIDPIAALGSKALIYEATFVGTKSLLLLIGVSTVAFASYILIGNCSYKKSYPVLSESYSGKVSCSGEINIKSYKYKGSQGLAIIERELKTLARTPDYLLNCIIPNLLYPLLLVLLYTSNIIGELIFYLKLDIYTEFFVLFGFCFMLFQSSLNVTAVTSLSRDGKDIFALKYMPINLKVYLRSKLAVSLGIGFINLILNLVILILIGIPPKAVKLLVIPSIAAVVFSNQLGIIFDLYSPKINWTNEWQVIRKNMTPIIFNIICTLLSGVTGYIMFYMQLNSLSYVLVLTLIFVLLSIFLYNVLCLSLDKILEIEE